MNFKDNLGESISEDRDRELLNLLLYLNQILEAPDSKVMNQQILQLQSFLLN